MTYSPRQTKFVGHAKPLGHAAAICTKPPAYDSRRFARSFFRS